MLQAFFPSPPPTSSATPPLSKFISVPAACAVAAVIGSLSPAVQAQDRKPTVEMTSILSAGLDTSGALTLIQFDLIFGPAGGATIDIVIKTAKGEDVRSFQALPEYIASKEAYSRVMVRGAMYAKLDTGDYLLDFVVEDELATRFPFQVVSQDDGDPFTTSEKKMFVGPWQKLAYLHFTNARDFSANTDYKSVNFRMWGGKSDLPAGSNGENLTAKLMRDDKLFGHSKSPTGYLSTNKPINRVDMVLFKPHGKQEEANVLALSEADLRSGNHDYRLTVERQSDGAVIREFSFQSKDDKLVPLPRTELGYAPHHEYLAPRAVVFGSQNYEFEPVHWLEVE